MTCVDKDGLRIFFLPALLILVMSLSGCAALAVTRTATVVTKTAVKATVKATGLAVKGVKAAASSKNTDKNPVDDTADQGS